MYGRIRIIIFKTEMLFLETNNIILFLGLRMFVPNHLVLLKLFINQLKVIKLKLLFYY